MHEIEWAKIRPRLRSTDWYLLGEQMPYSIAEALRLGSIRAMEGVLVRTRKNRFDSTGKRWCDIYLKLGE